jgi:hypothetical protein
MAMIFLIVVVSFAAVTLLSMSSSDLHDTTAQSDGIAALFLAETGVERASQLYASGTPCGAALLPAPAPAAPVAFGRGAFQSTSVAPVLLAGPSRCQLQVVGRVGNAVRTVQAELGAALSDITLISTAFGTKSNANAAPMTWNHNIPATAGANRILLVAVSLRQSGGTEAVVLGPQTTYGGLPLLSAGGVNHPLDGLRVEWLYVLNPPTGNANISVRIAPGTPASGLSVAFSSVDQTNPIDAGPVSSSGNLPANPTAPFTTATDKARVVDALAVRLAATATKVLAGQTVPAGWNTSVGGGNTGVLGAGSYMAAQSPAGVAPGPGWTLTGNPPPPLTKGWVHSVLALRPAPRTYVLNWKEI